MLTARRFIPMTTTIIIIIIITSTLWHLVASFERIYLPVAKPPHRRGASVAGQSSDEGSTTQGNIGKAPAH